MSKLIWIATFLLLGSFLLINFPQSKITEIQSFSTKSPIVFGYSNWAGWWPWAIAQEKGIFAKHGVNVELRWYDDYTKSLKDLAAGSIDGNCQTLNDTITFAQDAIKEEVVVLVNDNSAGNDKIIGKEGIEKVSDLKNQTVAVEAGVVNDFLLTLALDKADMSRKDVKILGAETGAAVEAFVAGQVDAVSAFPPFWFAAIKRPGAKEISSSAEFPGAIPDLLVVTGELIEQNPDAVHGLIASWFDVLDFISNNQTEADLIMAKRAGVTQQELQLLKAGTKMFSLEDNLLAFEDGNDMQSLSYAAKEISNFLRVQTNLIRQKPKISSLFNSRFISDFARTFYD